MSKRLRALIVEDNDSDELLVLRELRRGGFEVAHRRVENAADFADALATQSWDIVLSDFSLPSFSAPEALKVVQESGLDLPFVIISGTVGEELAVESMRAGANDYVLKSRLTRLCAVIERETREAERRRRERNTERSLARSEQRFRNLVETLQEGVWVFDVEGRTSYVNPRMAEMLGFTPSEMRGRPLSSFVTQEHEAEVERFIERRRSGVREQVDLQLQCNGGRRIYVVMAASTLEGEGGSYAGFLAGVVDLTDRRRLEEQLRVAQRMEAVGQLAGGVAHDFNNALTVILSHTGFLLEDCRDDHSAEDLRAIEHAARHATGLTRQLLAFGRRQIQKLESVDLNEAVDELAKMLRRIIGEHIALEVRPGANLWSVRADRGQIEQVLMNLAVNARDAMPNGGRLSVATRNLEITTADASPHPDVTAGRYVELTITDTGVGIPSDVRPRIFEPFFTTKEAGKGTGLGLATVYGIVKQSAGHIWVSSEPGEGTTFVILLPRDDRATTHTRPPAAAAVGPDPGATILVVEDDAFVRSALRRILSRSGHRVLEAADRASALELMDRHDGPIDLMVTDIIMPGLGPREFISRVEQMRPGLQVLYMSGYASGSSPLQGLLTEGAEFLEKPFTQESIHAKLALLLGRSRG